MLNPDAKATARTRAVIEDYLELAAQGHDRKVIAARLGFRGRDGLDAVIQRAHRIGLLTKENA